MQRCPRCFQVGTVTTDDMTIAAVTEDGVALDSLTARVTVPVWTCAAEAETAIRAAAAIPASC